MAMEKKLSITTISIDADVSTWTVRGWIRKGWLPAVKIGGSVRIAEKDYLNFIDSAPQRKKKAVCK